MTDPFPITWRDPADADVTWEWDDMHMPSALTPLAADYVRTITAGMAEWYRDVAGVPVVIRCEVWNGYAYYARQVSAPDSEHAAIDDRITDACRARFSTTAAYWAEAVPTLAATYAWVEGLPVETFPPDELASAWDAVWARIEACWSIHFIAIRGPYQVLDDLADLYDSVVPDRAPGDAVGLIRGHVSDLQDVERRLERLAGLAAGRPTLVARIHVTGTTPADLTSLPEAADFVAELEAFLAVHGHLGQQFDDLSLASWVEAPELLITEIAKRVDHPPASTTDERLHQMAVKADELAGRARALLADDPERAARFETLLAHARSIGPLTETHNYWIDRAAQSSLRRFVMRVGARLAEAGVFDDPTEILFFDRSEVPGLLLDPVDRRATVAERTATLDRQARTRPPRTVGKPSESTGGGDRFDGERFTSDRADELRGTGASAGVVRGRARLTLTAADFSAVQAGDIIVCPSSNPSWVPLFAIAGGLVTDTGGVLSHAAVVAREFALPAVVGTGDATQRIADGRQVEIDGTSGIVRLL